MPVGARKLLQEMQDKLFDMVKDDESIDVIRMEDKFSLFDETMQNEDAIKNKIIIREWDQLHNENLNRDIEAEDVNELQRKLLRTTESQSKIHNILFLDEIPAGKEIGKAFDWTWNQWKDWTHLKEQRDKDHLVLAIRPTSEQFIHVDLGGPTVYSRTGFQVRPPHSGISTSTVTCHLKRPYRYSKEVKRLFDFVSAHQYESIDVLDTSTEEEVDSEDRLPSGSIPTWLIGGTSLEVMEEVARRAEDKSVCVLCSDDISADVEEFCEGRQGWSSMAESRMLECVLGFEDQVMYTYFYQCPQ